MDRWCARRASRLQDRHWGLYLHDDYKLTRRLIVNLGLRYQIEQPWTERFNRLVARFDFDTSNPIEVAARVNYARNPIAELPMENFRVRGGLNWVQQGDVGRSPSSFTLL